MSYLLKEKLIENEHFEGEPENNMKDMKDMNDKKNNNKNTHNKSEESKDKDLLNDKTRQNIQKLYSYDGMDENNKKTMDVMEKEGWNAAVKHMFTDQKSKRQLSYSEMRDLYG